MIMNQNRERRVCVLAYNEFDAHKTKMMEKNNNKNVKTELRMMILVGVVRLAFVSWITTTTTMMIQAIYILAVFFRSLSFLF